MKKILLVVLMLLMISCGKEEVANTEFIDNYIVEPSRKLTNEVYDVVDDAPQMSGDIHTIMEDDDKLGFIKVSKDYAFVMAIYIETKGTSQFDVWSIDISFNDTELGKSTFFEFYHYGELFIADYKPETINMRYTDFKKALNNFNDKDVWYLIEKLEKIV